MHILVAKIYRIKILGCCCTHVPNTCIIKVLIRSIRRDIPPCFIYVIIMCKLCMYEEAVDG